MSDTKSKKIKESLTVICFLAFIFGFFVLAVLHTPATSSEAERRPLAQFAKPTLATVKSGTFFSQFDDYATDQFPARDFFRSAKAHFQLSVLNIKENNNLAIESGYIAKIDDNLNEAALEHAANRFTAVYDRYLATANTNNLLAIIPDKGYFFGRDFGYPSIDYDKLADYFQNALSDFTYVNLFDCLELDSYYQTDTHWRQEKLAPVVTTLAAALNLPTNSIDNYTVNEHYPFQGVYFGQSALNPTPDTLCYLSNAMLDSCTVWDYETETLGPIYTTEKLNSKEPYDVFLGGTKALLRIDNPSAQTERELIVFRDSYGASLIPLLTHAYSSITLIDLRYINYEYLSRYVEFNNQDVLFLYSTLLLNDSFAIK